MIARLRRWRQRLTGPAGRRVLLALALAAAWLAWLILPPWPLREWTTASREPADWLLTPDRTRLAWVTPPAGNAVRRFDPGTVRLWDLATGRERFTAGVGQPTYTPVTLRTTPDGSGLLITRPLDPPEETVLRLWDADTGRERWSVTLGSKTLGLLRANPVVSPDGRLVACRRSSGLGDVLFTATGQSHMTVGDAWPLGFAPDSRTLVTASAVTNLDRPTDRRTPAVMGSRLVPDRPMTVTLWDTTTGRAVRQFTLKQRFPETAAISPDGRWLAVGPLKNTIVYPPSPEAIELWDLWTGERAAELDFGRSLDVGPDGLQFSPDGSLLVAPSSEGSQRMWDVTQSPPRAIDISGHVTITRDLRSSRFSYPVFAPDGSRFVGPTPDGHTLAIRETAAPDDAVITGWNVWLVDRPEFAPDGRTLAVVRLATFMPLWQQALNRAYRAAGRPLPYIAEFRQELTFFDATTGAVRGQIGRLTDSTRLIGFGPDGRTAWTMAHTPDAATGDGTLRVQEWAVPTGRPPGWLIVLTALGLLLATADRRRERQRRAVIIRA